MTVFLIRRISQSIFVLFLVSLIVFMGVYTLGNPVKLLVDPRATQEEVVKITHDLGLDQPLHKQYITFLRAALKGDFGNSFVHNVPAIKLILQRLPATAELAFTAICITIFLGIPLGMWAGLRPDSFAGRGIMAGSILGFSLPSFWVGIMLVMLFGVKLGWLPTMGRGETVGLLGIELSIFTWDGLKHLLLPAVNLSLFSLSLVIRLTRAGLQETLPLDFVKFAKAKGLSPVRVICLHVMKNITIPIVTVLGLEFGAIIAFAVVTETVFAWPGMGKLIIDSINLLDRPVIVAYLLVTVTIFILVNMVVDIFYSVLDPRVRLGDSAE
ncbi:ABC transporter permease [bacterium]|nr:ABC transporter permease [bacterium]